jgi:hypothetical protein
LRSKKAFSKPHENGFWNLREELSKLWNGITEVLGKDRQFGNFFEGRGDAEIFQGAWAESAKIGLTAGRKLEKKGRKKEVGFLQAWQGAEIKWCLRSTWVVRGTSAPSPRGPDTS